MVSKKFLLTSVGSYGDINPLIALGKHIQAQGHTVMLATSAYYKKSIEGAGLKHLTVNPDYNPSEERLYKSILHPTLSLYYIHKLILNEAQLESSINDFNKIVKDYDYVIGNIFSYGAQISAKINNIPWISINLSPTCFFSTFDPPYLYPTFYIRIKSALFHKILFRTIFKLVNIWGKHTINAFLKNKLPHPGNLLMDAPFSKSLNLAFFPNYFAPKQKDWPLNTFQTDFILYSGENTNLPPGFRDFCEDGEKPIIITFGSVVGNIFEEKIAAINYLIENSRSRFVITAPKSSWSKVTKSSRVFLCEFIPYTTAFHHAKGIIHQGGIGTTATSLEAKIPQLILPGCTDQFDNAFRVQRNGLGICYLRKFQPSKHLIKTFNQVFVDNHQFTTNIEKVLNFKNSPFEGILEKICEI